MENSTELIVHLFEERFRRGFALSMVCAMHTHVDVCLTTANFSILIAASPAHSWAR